jgi:alanyl-tRNA synthetase
MGGNEIRERFLNYMAKRGHAIIPSAAIVPENDPTTLFTSSGMQPLVPFLMGETHPKGKRLANSQKCFRAEDIDEVGDNRHTTFFEMLGNWSLGDYSKSEQLEWLFTFLVDEIGLDPKRIYVTTFAGDDSVGIPKDDESANLWINLFASKNIEAKTADIGSEEAGAKKGMREGERIFFYESSKNWWSRSGVPANMPINEIGGPDSEVFYDFGTPHDTKWGENCHPNCDCGRFIEIGNSVFIEYLKTADGFEKLPALNVDFGGGLERIAAAASNQGDVFKIDLLGNIIDQIEQLSGKHYDEHQEAFRVIADHIRGAVFMIGDGVVPTNNDQGYFVRRLIRRAVRYADQLGIEVGNFSVLANSVIKTHGEHYPMLKEKHDVIIDNIDKEEKKFRQTLENGLKQFNKISLQVHLKSKTVDGKKIIDKDQKPVAVKSISAQNAFDLFTTYGFPIELTEEIAKEKGLVVDTTGFSKLMAEHKQQSRAGAEQKFKGGLADNSTKVVEYHTVTHLLLAALRHFLGDHVHQAGSNITSERLRFDFTHEEKLSPEILTGIENWVNQAIATGGEVTIDTMPKIEAKNDPTIEGSFWDRYPDEVKVYTIQSSKGEVFSRELCGGPHVEKLDDIVGKFVIKKEESSSAGVRRIKATLV